MYVTDALYYSKRDGFTLASRYIDIINPKPVDNRTAEEIAEDVLDKVGLSMVQ